MAAIVYKLTEVSLSSKEADWSGHIPSGMELDILDLKSQLLCKVGWLMKVLVQY